MEINKTDQLVASKHTWQFVISKDFVLREDLNAKAKFLYIVLKGYVNQNTSVVFPSRVLLEKVCNIGRDSLNSAVAALVDKGLLELVQGRDESGVFTHNVYVVKTENESQRPSLPCPENQGTVCQPCPENQVTVLPSYIEELPIERKRKIKEKEKKHKASKLWIVENAFEDVISSEAHFKFWEVFVKNRNDSKKPLTEHMAILALQRLRRFIKEGEDVYSILEMAAMCGWQGFWSLGDRAKRAGSQPDDRMVM